MSRLARVRGGDIGISLVELLVVMAISSMLLLVVGATFTSSLATTKDINSRTAATADGRLALDTVTRRLRVAVRPEAGRPMIEVAGQDTLTFYASLANRGVTAAVLPTKVEYSIDPVNSCLREALTPGVMAVVGGVSRPTYTAGRRSRCLVFGNVRAGTTPLFSFHTSGTAAASVALVAGRVALPDSIRSVTVSMSVRDRAAASARPTELRTRVGLVNRISEDLNGRTP